MKFFIAFLQSPTQHAIPAYSFWEHYIKNGIEESGHQWKECAGIDWAFGLVPKTHSEQNRWKSRAWELTLQSLKDHPVDVFLSYLYPEQIEVSAITEIKRMGIPCVNFFCDNQREFIQVPNEFSVFDLNWVPEYKAINLYQKAGFPYVNLPMPMWIAPNLRMVRPEINNHVTFIGSKDIQRIKLFEQITKLSPNIDLKIYGKGWDADTVCQPFVNNNGLGVKMINQVKFLKKNGVTSFYRKLAQGKTEIVLSAQLSKKTCGEVSFDDYNQLSAQSMITLGVNRYPSFRYPLTKPDTYSRLRDIEAPMLGACYLTELTDGIEFLYDLDNEIATYQSAEDFIEKFEMLKSSPEKRNQLKVNGQKRSLHEHSVTQSLEQIISRLK